MSRLFLLWCTLTLTLLSSASYAGEVVASDATSLDRWLVRAKDIVGNSSNVSEQIVSELDQLNDAIRQPRDIEAFRSWGKDDEAVRLLIPFAADARSKARIPSTLILANVVDNTNVCFVISYLYKNMETIDPNGRYNLLQVLLQVSNYAFSDNAQLMELYAQKSAPALLSEDMTFTRNLLSAIMKTLDTRAIGRDRSLRMDFPVKYDACQEALREAKFIR